MKHVRKLLARKKRTIKKHIVSLKHIKARKAIAESKKKDQSVLALLKKNDQANNPKGETLPRDMRLYRFDLIGSFLTAGIPLSKIDYLRMFLEKHGHRLTSHNHLRELVPLVLAKEKEAVKSELSVAQSCSVFFDGSTRLGEALAVIVQFVDSQWNVHQRLIRFQVLAKSLHANELAQCLIQDLAVDFATQPGALLAAMKDGASVNQAALRQVSFYFLKVLDVTCFSHTINNVGKHFEFCVLDTFAQYWCSMFTHSAAARLTWKDRNGLAMQSYSPNRWWSKFEVLKQVMEYFADVEPFLRENEQLAPAT